MLISVLKRHPHGGMYREPGTTYDCPERKARLLVSIGKAKYTETEELAPRGTYLNTSMVTAPHVTKDEITPNSEIKITDSAREILETAGVEIDSVTGTGNKGAITKRDAERATK